MQYIKTCKNCQIVQGIVHGLCKLELMFLMTLQKISSPPIPYSRGTLITSMHDNGTDTLYSHVLTFIISVIAFVFFYQQHFMFFFKYISLAMRYNIDIAIRLLICSVYMTSLLGIHS